MNNISDWTPGDVLQVVTDAAQPAPTAITYAVFTPGETWITLCRTDTGDLLGMHKDVFAQKRVIRISPPRAGLSKSAVRLAGSATEQLMDVAYEGP